MVHMSCDSKVLSIENLRKKASKRIKFDVEIDPTDYLSMNETRLQNVKLFLVTSNYVLKFNDSIFFD